MEKITVFCFFASYSLALGLEALYLWMSRPIVRILALLAGAAGLVAQTIYLYFTQPPLIWQFGWLMFVAWILVVFYLCEAVHHRRLSWGVFVLPLVLALVALGVLFGAPAEKGLLPAEQDKLWGPVHAVLILLATIGVCIGFIASLMYLFQAHRLRTKSMPGQGVKLWSLERLEAMNRRAIVLAFPLLTAGMLAGVVLLIKGSDTVTWTDPRVISTIVLWLAFAMMLYLRYGFHLRGRQVALMTIMTFVVLLCCVAISHHPLARG
jgi:ABC-type transport system involved in cytochrome c biogenesis permease subunit